MLAAAHGDVAVWISYGTASTRATRKADAVTRLTFSTSWAKANFDVRSIATRVSSARFVAIDIRQSEYPVALQAAMKGCAGEMWHRRLESVGAVVEREHGVATEGDDDRLVLIGQDR